jgi:hypothetical protein
MTSLGPPPVSPGPTRAVTTSRQPLSLPPRNPRPGREFPSPARGPLPGRCVIPQCAYHAVGVVSLLVEGYDAVLPVCRSHGDWVRGYVEEDADVTLR